MTNFVPSAQTAAPNPTEEANDSRGATFEMRLLGVRRLVSVKEPPPPPVRKRMASATVRDVSSDHFFGQARLL